MTADLILINADIVTMDPGRPRAQAMALRAGRVLALGTTEDIRALSGPATEVIDAGGRMALPGLQDTHIHLQDSGQDYAQNADLTAAATPDELVAALAGFAATHQRPWVNGTGWYAGIFGVGNLDRHVLDRAVPDRPCMIVASDGHNACLNSRAVELLALADAPDPDNGHFVRDAAGVPTGMLYETAIAWADERMPQPSDADFAAGVAWAAGLANRNGITGVLDAKVDTRHVRVYRDMAARDALTVRVAATALVNPFDSTADAVARLSAFRADAEARSGDRDAPGKGRFRVHSAKFFLDGVIENRTAAMIAPYSDTGGNAPLMFEPARIADLFTALDAARFQIHVHAIGDMATRAALDGMAAARAVNGAWPSLHQIAHIQFLDPADLPRFAALGVMGNVQPLWARHEVSIDALSVPAVGPARARWIYAFRALIDAGAGLALSSDWGVSSLNPFEIMETAVTRRPLGQTDTPAFLPEQRLTRAEALAGYTTQAAAAAWRGDSTGALRIGALGDFIVIDRDILTCDAHLIGRTEVLLTVLEGRTVHRRVL